NVSIGFQAGYNELGSDTLYISNSSTSTPLIYGLFSGAGAGITIYSQNTAGVPLVVQAIAGQTEPLQEWKNSSGIPGSYVKASGALQIDIPTATDDAFILKSTDNSPTKALLKTVTSSGASRFQIRGDHTIVHSLLLTAANSVAFSISPSSQLSSGVNQIGTQITFNHAPTTNTGPVIATGGVFSITNNSSVNIIQGSSALRAAQFTGSHNGASDLSNMSVGNFNLSLGANAGTLTNGKLISVGAATVSGGSLTNLFGIYVEDQNVGSALNYAIFTNAGDVRLMSSGSDKIGFHGATPIIQQTGVAVTDAAIHAALVNLGLITA
ncbi:hypothetical protein KAR91_21830, partial [Candidatus Pacearchaeota archaeon]|nr:hypothetical protein [Candidatus Pacearchaeota archaeon]